MRGPFWTSAFLDLAPGAVERGAAFWAAVTGYDATAVGEQSLEFPPLQPPCGDPYLWVQRVGDPPSRVHLDLHVDDIDASVAQAEGAGAELVVRRDHALLSSPAGVRFCLVSDDGASAPPPARWPSGHCSRVTGAAVVVPAATADAEDACWQALGSAGSRPLRIHVESAEDEAPRVLLEVGASDVVAEARRHEALGASTEHRGPDRWELRDPVGIPYRLRYADVLAPLGEPRS